MKRFDYCTIAGKNPEIYAAHVDNVLRNAGLPRTDWDFHTIIYRNSRISPATTDKLCDIARANDIRITFYDEVEGADYETFLHNLYCCWNLCQTLGTAPLSMRAGSDQAFGPNAFKNILTEWTNVTNGLSPDLAFDKDNLVLFHNCIECKANVDSSRHILENFGRNWQEFNEADFHMWCKYNEKPGLFDWKAANDTWGAPRDMPGLASNGRADGCSWLQSKALFKKFGPMPVRYANGLTGDIGLFEKYRDAGVPIRIVGNSTTYHFSRGGA